MKRTQIILGVIFFITSSLLPAQGPVWNGYLQTRLTVQPGQNTDLALRRAKWWVKGSTDGMNYKFQAVYRSGKDQTIRLQDVFAERELGETRLRIGRFVPGFNLQWSQPDAGIPVLERGKVIDAFMHGDHSIGRKIGVQISRKETAWSVYLGLFNGNILPPGKNVGNRILTTFRLTADPIRHENIRFHLGGSASLAQVKSLEMPKIFGAGTLVSGRDVRTGLEMQLHWGKFDLQAEGYRARIGGGSPEGYYAYGTYELSTRWQTVVMVDRYTDCIPGTDDRSWVIAGLNFLRGQPDKIMADYRFQTGNRSDTAVLELQYQLFFGPVQ